MPRTRIALTPRDLGAIEAMAAYGLSLADIASALSISDDTLSRRKADTDAVATAIACGRAKVQAKVGHALLKKALTGDVPAIRWFEATRFGYSEKHSVETRDTTFLDIIAEIEADERAGRARLAAGAE